MNYRISKKTADSITAITKKMSGLSEEDAIKGMGIPRLLESANQNWLNTYNPQGELVIPEGVTTIHASMFRGTQTIRSVKFPDTLKHIGDYAFYDADGIQELVFPESIETIGNYSFGYISNQQIGVLKKVTFRGKPTSISVSAFTACHYLTAINVPWGEGEVENAPWGASSATINYNYTEE